MQRISEHRLESHPKMQDDVDYWIFTLAARTAVQDEDVFDLAKKQ